MSSNFTIEKQQQYFNLAKYIADSFSKDPSTKVGAIFLYPDTLQIIGTGYNGFPRGITENPERWSRPNKYDYTVHAEMNLIYNSSRNGSSTKGAIAVITYFPCNNCALALIQSGISTILTAKPDFDDPRWGDNFRKSFMILNEAKVKLLYID
jgi:dCMP deaminase